MALIVLETLITAPAQQVFDLELTMSVHAASLAASGERATTRDGVDRLRLGDEVTFTARHFGLPWRMTSRVTAYAEGERFVDEQVRGPFAAMRHEHLFSVADGGTLMTDRFAFTAPLGPLGVVVDRVVFERYLRRTLMARAAHIKAIAEAARPL